MWNSDEELNSLLENSKDLLTIDKIELEWENINLIAKSSEGSIKILENLSGSARPGEITVIMGESGSGKSSLLSILSATIDLQSDLEVFGSIKLNGEDLNEVNRSKYIRFLDQEFILHESMTPYEFLYFQLKLRKNNPNDIIEKKINLILQRFGLTNVASCPIGGKLFRGLSGGERRRVAIAGELICSPSVLILDEPTSGLDSTLAKTVVGCLKEICQSGVTVLITIHQPGFEIFSMIDKLILIQKGCFLYQGTASESLNYFSSLGFEVPKLINPPDFYMQVIHIQDKNHLTEKELDNMMKLKNAYEFQKSTLMGHSFIRSETLNEVDEAPASFLSIVKLLIWREIISLKRNPIQCKIRVVQLIFYSFMNALLYQDLGLDSEGIENRRGFIIRVLTTCLIISVYTLALTISHERKIIIKEIQDNLYTVQSYLTFKILTEIPAAIITCILMSIAPYHFVNMNHEHDYKMWVFFLVILNCYFQGIIIGCLAGAISQNPVFVMTFSSVLINVAYVFSGVYTNPEAGPEVTAWLRFLSPILFLRDAAMKNEYQDLDYDDDIYPSPQEKFKYHREVSKNLLISLIHFVCNYLLACIFLRASLKKFTALKEKS